MDRASLVADFIRLRRMDGQGESANRVTQAHVWMIGRAHVVRAPPARRSGTAKVTSDPELVAFELRDGAQREFCLRIGNWRPVANQRLPRLG